MGNETQGETEEEADTTLTNIVGETPTWEEPKPGNLENSKRPN